MSEIRLSPGHLVPLVNEDRTPTIDWLAFLEGLAGENEGDDTRITELERRVDPIAVEVNGTIRPSAAQTWWTLDGTPPTGAIQPGDFWARADTGEVRILRGGVWEPLTANDVRNLGGRAVSVVLADVDAAVTNAANSVSDGILTPGEKVGLIPMISALRDGRAALAARAVALGVGAALSDYTAAMNALDARLLTLTSPVGWANMGGNTTVSDPVGFVSDLTNAGRRAWELQSACDAEAARRSDWSLVAGRPVDLATLDALAAAQLQSQGGAVVVLQRGPNPNLVRNGSFEAGLLGWTSDTGALAGITTSAGFSGDGPHAVVATVNTGYHNWASDLIPINAGVTYTVSGESGGTGTGGTIPTRARVFWYTSGGGLVAPSVAVAMPRLGVWTVWSLTVTAPATATQARVVLDWQAAPGALAVRRVKLEAGSERTPYGGQQGTLDILADRFRIWNGLTAVAPFEVVGGQVFIQSARIRNLTADNITAGAITSGWGDEQAGAVTATATWRTVASVTISNTIAGGNVRVDWSGYVELANFGNGTLTMEYRILRDGLTVTDSGIAISVSPETVIVVQGQTYEISYIAQQSVAGWDIDQSPPVAASITYALQVRGSGTVSNRRIFATLFRR